MTKMDGLLYSLRWFRSLFDDANEAEARTALDVVLLLSQDEGLRRFHFELYSVRPNAFLGGDLYKGLKAFCSTFIHLLELLGIRRRHCRGP